MRVALVQLTSTRDIDDNIQTCRRIATRAAEQTNPDWILFPENAPFLGRDEEKVDVAEPVDGPIVDAYRDIARDLGTWVTLGSFPETSPDPDRSYNTQVHIDPQGSVVDVYRKIHMFDVTVDDDVDFCESDSVHPGDQVVDSRIVDPEGNPRDIGLTICYDLRFPELYRILQAREVAATTVPSAFTLKTGSVHWHGLLQARAIENQCYVIAPNQWGHHFGKRRSYGQSAVYDPWGRRLTCASDRQGFVTAQLDFDYLSEIRDSMPVLDHRRIERLNDD